MKTANHTLGERDKNEELTLNPREELHLQLHLCLALEEWRYLIHLPGPSGEKQKTFLGHRNRFSTTTQNDSSYDSRVAVAEKKSP